MRVKLKTPIFWLIVILFFLPVLLGLFYFEEDWRGRHAWEKYKSQLKARGEVVDWNLWIPLSVPDNQNFFKAPKMQAWFVKTGEAATNELTERLRNPNTTANITSEAEAVSYLAWSDRFQPDFDLIRDALKRPFAQMDGDYSDPWRVPIQNYVALRALSQVLAQRAKCHFILHQSEAALRELTLLHESCRITESRPFGKPMTMVAAMINAAVVNVYKDSVAEGLRLHALTEAQLATIQKQLADVDLFPFLADAIRHERFMADALIENDLIKKFESKNAYLPHGWFYQNMVLIATWDQQLIDSLDLTDQIIFPKKVNAVQDEIEAIKHFRPYAFFALIIVPNFTKAFAATAQYQTFADEAQIACALERYRLAKGQYPNALAALKPQFITKIPHDIINGQPLHYRRTEAGKFLLYSVGWNEVDDNGQIEPAKTNSSANTSGDWVWERPEQ